MNPQDTVGAGPASAGRGPLGRAPYDGLAFRIAVVAFALRILAILVLGDPLGFYRVEAGGGLEWDWGYEQANVAQAVAAGEGFANPFPVPSGPTAWAAPVYPLVLGGLIKLFGGITAGVAWTLAIFQSIAAALTCVFLYRLGRQLYSDRAGLAGALLWAVHPMAIYLPVALVWDSTLVALSITWFLSAMMERGRDASLGAVAVLGAGLGLTLLVNPAPLALVPMFAWYYLRPRPGHLQFDGGGVPRVAVLLGAALLAASPWVVRNALVLGTPQIRSNLGVELFVGNNDGAFGPFNGRIHPAYNGAEMDRLLEIGEVEYAKEAGGRAVDWIAENPARFGRLSVERFQRFWIGPDPTADIVLGTGFVQERDAMSWLKWLTHATMGVLAIAGLLTWKGRAGSRTVMRGAFLFFPLVYYVTHVFERYRFPIEPLITLSAAVFLMRIAFGRKNDRARPDRGEV